VLNKIYVIKSLPRRILKHVLYGGPNLYEPHHTKNVTNDNFTYTHHHVVYKMPSSDQYKDFSKLFEAYMRIPRKIRTKFDLGVSY